MMTTCTYICCTFLAHAVINDNNIGCGCDILIVIGWTITINSIME